MEWKQPFYQLSEEIINKLKLEYKVLYPLLYADLDNIFENIPKEIEAEKSQVEYNRLATKTQRKCLHEPVQVHDFDLYGERMKNRYVTHCTICHKTWNESII